MANYMCMYAKSLLKMIQNFNKLIMTDYLNFKLKCVK